MLLPYCRNCAVDCTPKRAIFYEPLVASCVLYPPGTPRPLIVIWAIPTWNDWASYEKALYSEAEGNAWRADAARVGISWEGKLLNPAADSALQTGKIV